MLIKLPPGSHQQNPKPTPTEIDVNVHPIDNSYESIFNVYKTRAHTIKSPPDRALWRRAVYVPGSPSISTPPFPEEAPCRASPPPNRPPSPPICLPCVGYLGDEFSYAICSTCKAKYAAPSRRFRDEDGPSDALLSPSPCPLDDTSDTPIRVVDGYIAKCKKPCFVDSAHNYASQSASLVCSDDESDGCATPSSCSSSVYSLDDELDTDTTRLAGSTDRWVTPTLSSSSSAYSQDGDKQGAEADTRGYYDLLCVADYFDECQHSVDEENVEQDCSLAIDIHYR
ncbi:hypothetical protein ACQKWADRAFT_292381 [Trichoderma austrokoningii]